MANKVTFTIEVEMNERWVDDFCSMLNYMQSCGNLGHSALIGFYSDGDGDFRPTFKINHPYERKSGIWTKDLMEKGKTIPQLEKFYDAG